MPYDLVSTPSTSEVSQGIQTTSKQGQPSPVAQYTQPPPSPCRPIIVKYEPPSFSFEQPMQMFTQDKRNQVLQNHVAATNAVFNKVAVFECLIQQEPHNALYYEEVQRVQKNQHIHVTIKFQHIFEADLNDLQDYLDWTYQNTFGVYKTCGPPTLENKTSWP